MTSDEMYHMRYIWIAVTGTVHQVTTCSFQGLPCILDTAPATAPSSTTCKARSHLPETLCWRTLAPYLIRTRRRKYYTHSIFQINYVLARNHLSLFTIGDMEQAKLISKQQSNNYEADNVLSHC